MRKIGLGSIGINFIYLLIADVMVGISANLMDYPILFTLLDFKVTPDQIGLVLSLENILFIITTFITIFLSLRLSLRQMFLASFSLYISIPILLGLSIEPSLFCFGLILSGVAGALLRPVSISLTMENIPREARATALNLAYYVSAIYSLGFVLGSALYIINSRLPFLLSSLLFLTSAIIVSLKILPDTKSKGRKTDKTTRRPSFNKFNVKAIVPLALALLLSLNLTFAIMMMPLYLISTEVLATVNTGLIFSLILFGVNSILSYVIDIRKLSFSTISVIMPTLATSISIMIPLLPSQHHLSLFFLFMFVVISVSMHIISYSQLASFFDFSNISISSLFATFSSSGAVLANFIGGRLIALMEIKYIFIMLGISNLFLIFFSLIFIRMVRKWRNVK